MHWTDERKKHVMIRWQKIVVIAVIALALILEGCAGIYIKREETLQILPDEIPGEVSLTFMNAEEAFKENQTDRAMTLFGEILARVPRGKVASWAHLRRGELLQRDERYRESLEELQAVPERFRGDPLYNEARYLIATSYHGLGMYDKSEEIIKRLVKEDISSRLRAQIFSLSGDNLAARGKYYAALLFYVKSLREGPGKDRESSVKERIETTIEDRLTLNELEDAATQYRIRYPAGYILYSLARIQYEMGNFEESASNLNKFLLYHFGHPLAERGRDLRQRISEIGTTDRYAIGCILPLTGRYSVYGERALDAIILAAGTFDPRSEIPVKLIIEDSKSDPIAAREAVEKLAEEDNVIGIIGPLGSTTSAEAAKEAQRIGIPILTLTQKEGITETGDYVFRNFLTSKMQIKSLVKYTFENLGLTSFAILYPDDSYGTEMMNLFWDEVLNYGGEIRGVESYETAQTDFGKEIKSIVSLDSPESEENSEEAEPFIDFDALFIPDSSSRIVMIAPQLAFYDVTNIQLLGTSSWNSPELLDIDSKNIDGAIFTDGFFLESHSPSVREFIDRFYTALGREPGNLEALAYDSARIIVTVMTEMHTEVRGDLRDNLLLLEDYPGITGTTSFSETGDAEKTLYILMVSGNEIEQIQ
jgi:branched-chain amino acid transport system substrate-binding protein